jgi:hypothetical protein
MEPKYWGDYPINANLYYDNDQPIGVALNRLFKRQTQNQILLLNSESPAVSDGVLLHLARILCQLRELPFHVLWFTGYPSSDFSDFGVSLRRFLLELWKAQDFKLMGDSELTALSFEIAGCSTPEQYLQMNIAALGARNTGADIFIVIDIQEVSERSARQRIQKLVELFLQSPASGWRRAIAVQRAVAGEHSILTLSTPPGDISVFLNHSRGAGGLPAEPRVHDQYFATAAPFIHSLVALNQPAQRSVLNYIMNHSPNADQEIRQLVETASLWTLGNDCTRIAPRLLTEERKSPRKSGVPAAFFDTIPNGAKILSFQGLDRLLPQISRLREIEDSASDATRIVDLYAMAVGQKCAKDSGYSDTLSQLISELKGRGKVYAAAEENASRSLLFYSSQLLLTHPSEFGASFFRLLEQLTIGYVEFVRLQHSGTSPRMYEASRWLTNLGFIYDRIRPHASGTNIADRANIYAGAASYLSNLNPEEIKAWSETRYSEAWQLWDAGKKQESVDRFVSAAWRVIEFIQDKPYADETLRVIAQEFFAIAFALMPERLLDKGILEFLEQLLDNYGSKLTLNDLVVGFTSGAVLLDSVDPRAAVPDDVVIIACYFDFHIALLAAQAFRRHFGRATKVVLLPGGGDHDPQDCMTGHVNLLIGAPDTPGPIGKFVSACDIELVRLYQLRLFGNFGAAIENQVGDRKFHLLTACGLAGNLTAWQSFLERNAASLKNKVSPMDELLRQLLLPPLIAAETKVFTAFIDRLLSKLGRRKDESKRALERLRSVPADRLDQAVTNLDGDVKSALVDVSNGPSIAQALDEAMEVLRSKDLDLNQLVNFATLAYEYATRIQRTFPPASNQESKLGVFVSAFRDQRSHADILRQEFLALPTGDHRRLNAAAETLAQSLRNFRQLTSQLS